jgi:hypothetical protein
MRRWALVLLNAEQFRHFALRLAAGKMQPGCARGERGLFIHLQCWLVQRQRLIPFAVFMKIFS